MTEHQAPPSACADRLQDSGEPRTFLSVAVGRQEGIASQAEFRSPDHQDLARQRRRPGVAHRLQTMNVQGIQLRDLGSPGQQGCTGVGLAALADLPKLERLTVGDSPFNDDGMAALGKRTLLKHLGMWHTFQIAAGNAHLAALKPLKSLRLGQRLRRYDGKPQPPSLTDAPLDTLATMTGLETLFLDEARLSGAALAKLKTLPNLKTLTRERLDVPAGDVERLRQLLPGVRILWQPLTEEGRQVLDRALGR